MKQKLEDEKKQKLFKETEERAKRLINQWKEKVTHAKSWKVKHLHTNEVIMQDVAKIEDEGKRIALGGELQEDLATYQSKKYLDIIKDRTDVEITTSIQDNLDNYKLFLGKLEKTQVLYTSIQQETQKTLKKQREKRKKENKKQKKTIHN